MAENEVKIDPDRLYYRKAAGPASYPPVLRFQSHWTAPRFYADSRGFGMWLASEIAQSFQPAPDLGARFAPKGTAPGAGPVSVVVQATEGVIACESAGYRNTYFPADFFAAFEPYREAPIVRIQAGDPVRFRSDASFRAGMTSAAAHARAPREGWLAFEAFTLDPCAPEVFGGRDVRIKHPTYCSGDCFWVCTNRLEADPVRPAYKADQVLAGWAREGLEAMPPTPMFLTCPKCNARHIDEGEFATKPHHTHSCQACGLTWRPAVVTTVGVAFLPGFKNDDGHRVDR